MLEWNVRIMIALKHSIIASSNFFVKWFVFRIHLDVEWLEESWMEKCLTCLRWFKVFNAIWWLSQVVAVKQLDRNGLQGNREFLVEVLMLSLLHHPNLVNLIGYCADGDQRLLVYEFMPFGSLEDHLHGNSFF